MFMRNQAELATARVIKLPVPFRSGDEGDAGTTRGARRTPKSNKAVAQLERHRAALRVALAVALLARLVFDFQLPRLLEQPANLVAAVPLIGLALLAYMVVLWFLTTRARDRVLWFLSAPMRDRLGFGMALGIGVLEVTFLVGTLLMERPFTIDASWPLALVAVAHVPLIVTALHASTIFPPHDGKRPWVLGFGTALMLVGLSWVTPALLELGGR